MTLLAGQPSKDHIVHAINTLDNDTYFVRKTANESVTSSTTLQNDDHLLFPVAASEIWTFDCVLFYGSAATAADIKVAFTVPAATAIKWGAGGADTAVTGFAGDARFEGHDTSGSAIAWGTAGAGNYQLLAIKGIVVVSSTAGNVQLQWAQNTSDASATTVYTNSHLLARRVS